MISTWWLMLGCGAFALVVLAYLIGTARARRLPRIHSRLQLHRGRATRRRPKWRRWDS